MSNPVASPRPEAAVIGAGPAGLMAAEILAQGGAAVTVFDHMPSVARKFLMAGRGGLNLTHGEPLEAFLTRYRPAAPPLLEAIRGFPPVALIAWCEGLGEPTFTGSSGRIFPKSLKASPLLRAWLGRLGALGVVIRPRHRWNGFGADGALRLAAPEGEVTRRFAAVVLALGGASWPRLGSDGAWPRLLPGVAVAPFAPSNVGFAIDWSPLLRERHAGAPLKRIAIGFEGQVVRGEAVLTATGIEGGAIYALSAPMREAIAREGEARFNIDLRPDLPEEEVRRRLAERGRGETVSAMLRKALGLAPAAVALVQELRHRAPAADLATLVKALPLVTRAAQPMARAISSAGGLRWEEVDDALMLRAHPGVFACGEMLDWEAPTGGYLLQACFATGLCAARGALRHMGLEGS